MFHRSMYDILLERIRGPRQFIQILAGPRQTGKTTIINQLMDDLRITIHYAQRYRISMSQELSALFV